MLHSGRDATFFRKINRSVQFQLFPLLNTDLVWIKTLAEGKVNTTHQTFTELSRLRLFGSMFFSLTRFLFFWGIPIAVHLYPNYSGYYKGYN